MTLDMTKGEPLRSILKFAFPLMLAAALQMLYTTVDSLIIGRLLGTDAFAAVGAAAVRRSPLFSFRRCSISYWIMY